MQTVHLPSCIVLSPTYCCFTVRVEHVLTCQLLPSMQVYTIYSILCIVFIILVIVTAFITIALTYFQLAVEDHRWWWRSFLCGGSTGPALFVKTSKLPKVCILFQNSCPPDQLYSSTSIILVIEYIWFAINGKEFCKPNPGTVNCTLACHRKPFS